MHIQVRKEVIGLFFWFSLPVLQKKGGSDDH